LPLRKKNINIYINSKEDYTDFLIDYLNTIVPSLQKKNDLNKCIDSIGEKMESIKSCQKFFDEVSEIKIELIVSLYTQLCDSKVTDITKINEASKELKLISDIFKKTMKQKKKIFLCSKSLQRYKR